MYKTASKTAAFFLIIFVALIFSGGITYSAQDQNFKSINYTIEIVKNNYVTEVDQLELINNGISALKKYLTLHKKDYSYIKDLDKNTGSEAQVKILKEYINTAVNENKDLKYQDITDVVISGIVDSLGDQFSKYMTPKEYKLLIEQMEGGNFGGLGVAIELDPDNNNALTVVRPLEGTPAEKAGLASGDVITKVNGKSIEGISIEGAQNLLRGKVGSTVNITVYRKKEDKTFDATLTRALIHIKSASYKIIDDSIGYIKLDIFGEDTSYELEEALNYFDSNDIKGYILDLRNNGGGYIETAVSVCSKFLPTNTLITSIEGRKVSRDEYKSMPNPRKVLPMAILVNRYSASASEITAAALKSKNVPLIGEKTFGKASVQRIIPSPDGGAIKLTTAYYCTPEGKNINKIGIEPDIVIKFTEDDILNEHDVQLEETIKILKKQIEPVALKNK
ncbi:MAG: S41 family peptidase [Armatimonadota bacterium]